MKILCTNDDGIHARGLECLAKAASKFGEVTVVAPDREQSATSHSLTLHHPLRVVQQGGGGERRYQIDGTPTDCVLVGIEAIMQERPDFVLSGINHGQNLGEDVLYSGTVAGAMEGLAFGIPSIAISFAGKDLRADPATLEKQIVPLESLLKHLLSLPEFPQDTLLNVNLPPTDTPLGVKLTRLGRRAYSNSLTSMHDPWGRKVYWIGGGKAEWSGEEDSDFKAIQDGYISITPLHLDLTHHAILKASETWWRDF